MPSSPGMGLNLADRTEVLSAPWPICQMLTQGLTEDDDTELISPTGDDKIRRPVTPNAWISGQDRGFFNVIFRPLIC